MKFLFAIALVFTSFVSAMSQAAAGQSTIDAALRSHRGGVQLVCRGGLNVLIRGHAAYVGASVNEWTAVPTASTAQTGVFKLILGSQGETYFCSRAN